MTPLRDHTAATLLFRRLLARAKDRVLFVSPPYSDPHIASAFLAGYETALKDMAKGEFDGV